MRRILALALAAALLLVLLWMGGGLLRDDRASPGDLAKANPAPALEPFTPTAEPEELEPVEERVQVQPGAAASNETATVDPDATTGTLVILCLRKDGEPLPGVGIVVEPAGPMGRNERQVVADGEGRALVGDLPPGKTKLWSHQGAWKNTEVVAGEVREVRLEFGEGVAVKGTVVDAHERPVGGAEVWLAAWRRDWLGMRRVAITDEGGGFAVPFVGRERSLGATADGHGPSELTDLSQLDLPEPPVELRLQLTSAGGNLSGRVLGPSGEAVPGARVAVGESPPDWSIRNDGSEEEKWTARVAVTGADGTFSLEGLAAATHPVHVLAEGFPILGTEVEITEGVTATLDLQLERGLQVTGVVRGEDGAPIEAAVVLALDAPFDDPFPNQGPTEVGVPFRTPGVRSAEDGSFTLGWMPAGDVYLYSSKGSSFWDDREIEYVGTAQETLTGERGDTLTWNPILTLGQRIHGRVFYSDGEPMRYVFVSAIEQEDQDKRYTAHSKKDGSFSIPGLTNQAYRVHVQLWDAPDDYGGLEQTDVWPSDIGVELYAGYAKSQAEEGTVRLRVEDEAERIAGSVLVMMQHDMGGYYTDEKDGVHEVELPPGRYRPIIYAGDVVVGGGDWFELEPGQVLDLGTIRTSFAGSLTVNVVHGEGVDPERLWINVRSSFARRHERIELEEGQFSETFDDLCVGEAVVHLQGIGVADVRRDVTIERNVPAELTLETAPAVLQTLVFTADEKRGWGKLDIVITDESGALYAEVTPRERWAGELPYETKQRMPFGRFRVEATTTSGLAFQGELVIESLLDPEPWSCKLE